METQPASSALEIARLQRCISDLISVAEIPAVATRGDATRVVQSLSDALVGMLDLEFVYARLDGLADAPIEAARGPSPQARPLEPREIGAAIALQLGPDPEKWPLVARAPPGEREISLVPLRLGPQGELGVIVAACGRADFPTQTDTLLLNVAANQATLGLREAQTQIEQKRLADELDRRVAERTAELAGANDALRTSERDSRLIVDSIPGLVAAFTPAGEVEFVNRQVIEYFGKSFDELKRWEAGETTHPEDLPRVVDLFAKAVASGEPFEFEVRARRHDGVYRWFQSRGFPLRDANGRIARWYNLLIDIDERKRAEEAVAASEHESRLMVDNIPALVSLGKPTGPLEFVNRQVLEYTGKTLEELKHWSRSDVFHPDDRLRTIDGVNKALKAGEPYDIEHRLRRFDGVYRWFETRVRPAKDRDGRVIRFCAVLTDIDDRKRAEEALRESERSLRSVVDGIPGLVAILAPDGDVSLVNRQIIEYCGRPLEELKQWGTNGTVHAEDLPNVAEVFTKSIASGVPYAIEQRLRRFDGEYRWFHNRGIPVRDASGDVACWYVLLTDIDDRKRTEDALRLSEYSMRQLTETIPEMLWRATPEGVVDYCNARLLEYTGFGTSHLIGKDRRKLVHPEDFERAAGTWRSCVATGSPYSVEIRFFHASDNTYRWCVSRALPLMDKEGRVLKWHGAVVDMHDWKQAQEDLREAQARLAHTTRVMTMGAMTASIAHEVAQPLSGIITNASTCLRMLAAEPPNVDGARETARRTIRDGNRASEVITRLRALFSRKDQTSEPVDLNEAAREVLTLSWTQLQKSHVVLRSDLAADLPPIVGDRVQLQQVILNLLLNAADAMSSVQDRPRGLLVRTEVDEGERVRLTVRDSGTGFDPQAADKLFDAFYTTKSGGMGIGLSVSRSIIESHGGRIWATGNDGPGATFSFSLPCKAQDVASASRGAA
jgi:PAS domain S-box-containing protein